MKPLVHAALALILFRTIDPGVGNHAEYLTASIALAAGLNRSTGMAILLLLWLALLPDDLLTEGLAVAFGISIGTALRLLIGETHEPIRPTEQTAHGNHSDGRPVRPTDPLGRDHRNDRDHAGWRSQ